MALDVEASEVAAAATVAEIMAPSVPRFRSPAARPRSMGWRAWVDATADCLRDVHRAPDLAASLRACGRLAWVTACGACGDFEARVEIRASCDVRVCPWCARRRASARADVVADSCARVVEMIPGRRESVRARVEAEKVEAQELVDRWMATAEAAAGRRASRVNHWSLIAARAAARAGDPELSPRARVEASARCDRARRLVAEAIEKEGATERRAMARAAAAGHRVVVARRELHAIRESESVRLDGKARKGAWRWRLVTISPRWNPADPSEVDAAGLRRRADDALARWARCWREGARAGGLAAAYASVECSSAGHVHVHVLYLGPWVASSWWRDVAGCFVDVRAVDQKDPKRGRSAGSSDAPISDVPGVELVPAADALKEAVKYALKSPSPHAAAWIAGASREVAHPRLAAAWVWATRHHQIARAYGVMRSALDVGDAPDDGDVATDAAEDAASVRECRCASCGAELGEVSRPVETARLARTLGARWSLHPSRAGDGSTLGALPPRVTTPRFAQKL